MLFHVTLDKAEDGWIVAECPALPGCVSHWHDEKEALQNIREAITAWMWADDQKPHKELSVGALRALIRAAGMTVEEFLELP